MFRVALQQALQKGSLRGNESLPAKVTLEIPGLGVKVPFDQHPPPGS